ncbi:glycosyltransferase family 2 protein [Haloglomus litoreum]|uniref:glycosyltransferase family 2 protein n=1 Tax=Haloglomus litoreum TaxID=3034026 RepID=UPI0023E79F06|nr:glycosyltransferase family 2 protein [Haloglomus sp. DT116]
MTATDPLVSYVVATYNRPTELAAALDSILQQSYRPLEVVVVSSSTDETGAMFEPGGRFDLERVHYHQFDERMGVPKARNLGYERAAGEFLVTIDDDAVLPDPEATGRMVSLFSAAPDVGVLAFQSRSHETGDPILMEIPDPPDLDTPPSEPYRASSFCGVGNAIRREVIDDVGAFPPEFVYGFEEHDLSLRLLDAGYDIRYTPEVVVSHKQTPKARLPPAETRERGIENRIRLAVRNLPWRYVLFTTLVWSAYGVVTARGRVGPVWRVLVRLYGQRRSLLAERQVVSAETIARLKSRSTMLYGWWFGPDPRRIIANPRRLTW